tara:strand:+ start:43 stop:657 length:615 start_codon:yes stop_codon:yes gene_type:complete
MNILTLFSSPIFMDMYELDEKETQTIKNESFYLINQHDGYATHDREILKKYPKLLNVCNQHIVKSIHNELKVTDKLRCNITSSWLNKHPPQHSANRHTHKNSMFTGVLYIDCPQDSGEISFTMSYASPTWNTGTIEPELKEYNILNSRRWFIPTVTGMCILFPSHLEHDVTVNKSNQNRYSLGFNVMIDGQISDENELLSIRVE